MNVVESAVREIGRWREALRTLGDKWGTTESERTASFPCDLVLPDADQWMFRAIGVDAPAAVTFRRLCQLRVAPYSYDWIDNLGKPSPTELTPGLDDIQVGQRCMTMFTIVDVEHGQSLTFHSPKSVFGEVGGTYRVVPVGDDRSRIVVKIGINYPSGLQGELMHDVLPAGDLFMMSKQLRNLASLAARDHRSSLMRPSP